MFGLADTYNIWPFLGLAIVDDRFQLRLLPVGYRLRDLIGGNADRQTGPSTEQEPAAPH